MLHYLARYTHRVAISNHRLHRHGGREGQLSLERLCPWRQEAQDDAGRRGVYPPFSDARVAQGAWCAFATTAGWPIAAGASGPRNAGRCLRRNRQPPVTSSDRIRAGVVRPVEAQSRWSRGSFPAIYHVTGHAEDVNLIALRASFLLTGHAGRGARIPGVCLHGGRFRESSESADHGPAKPRPRGTPDYTLLQSSAPLQLVLRVPKHNSKHISAGAASAANASGSLQTALSKVTRRSAFPHTRNVSRRVTSDRVLTFIVHDAACTKQEMPLDGTNRDYSSSCKLSRNFAASR